MKSGQLEGVNGSLYVQNFIIDEKKLFNLCKEEIIAGKSNFQVAGSPGPIVAAFHKSEFPKYILPVIDDIAKLGLFGDTLPFQISFNYYPDGDHSLSPHKDARGEQAIIISLGSTIGLDFYYHPSNKYSIMIGPGDFYLDPIGTAILEPGSLLLFSGESFTQFLHGISKRTFDEVNDKTLNKSLIQFQKDEKIPRGERISIVIWSDSPTESEKWEK